MLYSAELRWFFEGEPSDAARDWFDASGRSRPQSARVDAYLALPGCETAGIKLRENRLEIKARTAAPERLALGGVEGLCDGWLKWSLAPDDAGPLRRTLAAGGDQWVPVEKRRRLRKFSTDGPTVAEIDADDILARNGCQLELAALRVLRPRCGLDEPAETDWTDAASWWSLSLEAFGELTRLRESLARAAAAMLVEPPALDLESASSLSYPSWLNRRILR